MRIRHALVLVLLAGLAGGELSAAQQPPARDRASAPQAKPAGTASISGVVLTTAEPAQPLRHVTVLITLGQFAMPRAVVTDGQGRFLVEGLVAGRYMVTTQKPAWVAVTRGLRSVAGQSAGIPVVVKDGEAVTGVTLRMHKGVVLTGVVRLPSGRPAAGTSVMALAVVTVSGRRQTSMVAMPATADDQGQYRLYGLPPGQYVVQARETAFGPGTADMRQTLPSEVRWAEALVSQAAPAPGGVTGESAPAPEAGPTLARAATYYPGTNVLADAALLTVQAGEERTGLDFEAKMVPTATISGTVIGLDGKPAGGAAIGLQVPSSVGQEELMTQMLGAGRATSRPDGTFVVSGVAPGTYEVLVRASSDGRPAPPVMGGLALAGGRAGQAPLAWAREVVEVNGRPVGPLVMQVRPGLKVSGTIVFEGATPPALTSVRIGIGSPGPVAGLPDLAMFRPNQAQATAKADGTFEAAGILPGQYELQVMAPGMRIMPTEPGQGWMLKSVRVGERDLTDEGLDLRAGQDLSGVVVTLTDRPSELTGRVLDGHGRPVADYPVVVFSADRAQWRPGGRRVHSAQPATDGSFLVAGLPAGQYHLAVVTDLDARELASAAFLESLVASSITVSLADGEKKTQDVRIR